MGSEQLSSYFKQDSPDNQGTFIFCQILLPAASPGVTWGK